MWYVKLLGLLRAICRMSAYAGALVLLACVAMTVVNVVMRNFLASSILGSVELTELAVVWAAFLTIPLCFAYGTHISVDFVTTNLGDRVQLTLRAIGTIVAGAVMLGYAWWGGQQAIEQIRSGQSTTTLGLGMAWFWIPVVYGTVLSLVASVLAVVNIIAGTFQVPETGVAQ